MILFLIITLCLDLLIKYLYPSMSSILLTSILVIIFLVYSKKKTYLLAILFGIIYDLLYTDIGLINVYINILIICILNKLFSRLNINFFSILLSTILIIIIYNLITYIVLLISSNLNTNLITILINSFKMCSIGVTYNCLSYSILNKYYLFKRQ